MATGDDVQAPVDQRADVADNIAEEGSAVLVLMGEKDDMTNVVEDQGAVNVQVPGNDGGGAAEVTEGADTAKADDGGGDVCGQVHEGGTVPV